MRAPFFGSLQEERCSFVVASRIFASFKPANRLLYIYIYIFSSLNFLIPMC